MQSISNSVSPNPLTNCSTSSTISDWLSAYSSPDPHARFRALPKSNSTKSRRSTRWTSVACLQQWPDTERERWVWNLGRIEWRSSLRGLELTISVELYYIVLFVISNASSIIIRIHWVGFLSRYCLQRWAVLSNNPQLRSQNKFLPIDLSRNLRHSCPHQNGGSRIQQRKQRRGKLFWHSPCVNLWLCIFRRWVVNT